MAGGMTMPGVRAIVVCLPSRAYGELNVAMPLAQGIRRAGGEAWLLASPLAARVSRRQFTHGVFEATTDRATNQTIFWRMVKKYRPNLIVFSELYEIIQPRRRQGCPLIDRRWLSQIARTDLSLAFIDFIAHVSTLHAVLACPQCSRRLGAEALRSFFERLWVVLPCPLNEPAQIPGRRGIPFSIAPLPGRLDPERRAKLRRELLGTNALDDSLLILRTGSTWQAVLAEQSGVSIAEFMTPLFELYFSGLGKQVTVVNVSDRQTLAPSQTNDLRTVNLKNLPPDDYEKLLLASDLLLTDNEIGYTLAKTLGNVPAAVMVNSFTAEQVVAREGRDSRLARLVTEMERQRPGCVFPYRIFPLRVDPGQLGDDGDCSHDLATVPKTIRLNRMPSSPFLRLELLGGASTREALRRLLEEPSVREAVRSQETAYLQRLETIEGGPAILSRLVMCDSFRGQAVL
jgi:hypothetical protein